MKKDVKKENMKVKESLKKATRENKNIEEQLDDVSGGVGGLFGSAGFELEDVSVDIKNDIKAEAALFRINKKSAAINQKGDGHFENYGSINMN